MQRFLRIENGAVVELAHLKALRIAASRQIEEQSWCRSVPPTPILSY